MHILLTPAYYPSLKRPTAGIFFHEQAMALHKTGHQVGVLIAPRWEATAEYLLVKGRLAALSHEAHFHDFSVYRMHWGGFSRWMPVMDALLVKLAGRRAFRQYCAEHGTPDVLHGHDIFYGGYLAAALSAWSGIPAVVTEHSTRYQEGKIIFPGQAQIIRYTLHHTACRLAVGAGLARSLLKFAPEQPIDLIGNVVDTEFFIPPTHLLPSEPFVFAMIGSLEHRKRYDLLVEAFGHAFMGQPVQLKIGGEVPNRLQKQIDVLDLSAQITLLGKLSREEVRELFQNSHAIVSSSDVETFGVTLIEAMACGKPVVATRSGGPEGFVTEGEGLLAAPDDMFALANALREVRQFYQRYDSAAIRAACMARFSEKAIVQQLDAIYSSLSARAKSS